MSSHTLQFLHANHPRNFNTFSFVYLVFSRRTGGISIGVNLNLDKNCNFDCPYCQVNRQTAPPKQEINLKQIEEELLQMLSYFTSKGVCKLKKYQHIAPQDKKLTDISISGDGEPTMVKEFKAVCQILLKIQKKFPFPFLLNLITNSTLLNKPRVQQGIECLLKNKGQIWAKLDAGTQEWYQKVNVSNKSLNQIEHNLIYISQQFPIIIQTLFFKIESIAPSKLEIQAYCQRINNILKQGGKIQYIQLHSIIRSPANPTCSPLAPLEMAEITGNIQSQVNLPVKLY